MSLPLQEWVPVGPNTITYTHDEAIVAQTKVLNDYNALLDKAVARGDAGSIALYKQLIKQVRAYIYDLRQRAP